MSKLSLSDKAGLITIADTIKYVITLLLGFCLVRLFSQEAYGTYQQTFLVVWTLVGLLPLGFPSGIYYFVPQLSDKDKNIIIRQTIVLLFLLGLLAYITIYAVSGIIASKFSNPHLEKLLKIFGLNILPLLLLTVFGPVLICYGKTKKFAIYTLVSSFLTTIFIFVFAFNGFSLAAILLVNVIMSYICALYALVVINRLVGLFKFEFSLPLLISQIKYSLPIGFSGMIGYLGKQLDKFVIALFFLPASYAVYNVGAIEIPIAALLISSVDSVALPEIVQLLKRNKKEEFIQLWQEMIRKVAMILAPIMIYCLLLAPVIITFLYTEAYSGAIQIFQIYLLILLLRFARFSVILQAVGRSKIVLVGAILFLFLNTGLNFLFIKIIGFTGPAWSTIVSIFCLAAFYFYQTKRYTGFRIYELYPFKKIGQIIFYSILAACLAYPVLNFSMSKLTTIMLSGFIFCTIYLVLLVTTKFLQQEDLEFVKKWLCLGFIYKKRVSES